LKNKIHHAVTHAEPVVIPPEKVQFLVMESYNIPVDKTGMISKLTLYFARYFKKLFTMMLQELHLASPPNIFLFSVFPLMYEHWQGEFLILGQHISQFGTGKMKLKHLLTKLRI
jgi:hypothetical protein